MEYTYRNIVVAEDNCLQVYDTAVSLKLKASTSFGEWVTIANLQFCTNTN